MKNIKKIIAFVLCAVMVMAMAPFAFAEDVSYNQDCPYIYVHGFVGNVLYDDPTSPDAKAIFPPETDDIVAAATSCMPALAAYALTGDGDMLADKIVPVLEKLFEPAFLDKDGNPGKSGPKFSYPSKNSINSKSRLAFVYDWRLDPVELAAQLNDYIEYVCDASGCEKVAIMAHSFGGVVTLAYTSIYGMDRLKGVMMNSTAIYGETYTGELMTGELMVDMDAVREFVQYALNETEYTEIVDAVFAVFKKAGLSDFLEKSFNQIIADAGDDVMKNVVFPMFIQWPSIWAMIPDEYFEDAYKFVFDGENAIDKEYDYSALKAKINSYNSLVRDGKTEKLVEMEDNMNFGVMARYGFSAMPVTSSWQIMSDGVVDTKNASFGATTAKHGQTLSESYLSGVDAKYVSPDKTIDASTCLFPEKTWFIKNYGHTHSQLLPELTMAVLYAENEVTVDTYEAYPRYIIYSDGEFTPQDKDDTLNPFQKLIKFFKQLFALIKTAFAKLFN